MQRRADYVIWTGEVMTVFQTVGYRPPPFVADVRFGSKADIGYLRNLSDKNVLPSGVDVTFPRH